MTHLNGEGSYRTNDSGYQFNGGKSTQANPASSSATLVPTYKGGKHGVLNTRINNLKKEE